MNHPNTPHRAAVITTDGVYYGNGTYVHSGADLSANLAKILHGTIGRFQPHCTIIIDRKRTASGTWPSQLAQVKIDGWQYGETDGAWKLFHRDGGRRTVAVGWRPDMDPKTHLGVLFERDTRPDTLAVVLDRYHRLTGMSWRGTPATTAHAGLRLSWPNAGQQPRWSEPFRGSGQAVGALWWSRKLTPAERSWGFLHTFDARSAYLGAMGNAEVAWSELGNSGRRPFDKYAPGYWLIDVPACVQGWPSDGRPPLVDPRQIRDGRLWVTTPYAALLAELQDGPLVVRDSWTGSERGRTGFARGHRVMRNWAETIRDALRDVESTPSPIQPTLRTAIKRTYKDAIGGMQRLGMRVSRPDWAHHVIDLWRATLVRKMIRVHATQGVWPVEVITDSLTYADCVEYPQARRLTGDIPTLTDALGAAACLVDGCHCTPQETIRLGTFSHEKSWTVATWDEAHQPKPERAPRVPRVRRERVAA